MPCSAPTPDPEERSRQRGPRRRDATPTTRVSLIARCADGCNASWSEFFHVYAPLVTSYALHARLTHHEAEDVVANVMEKLMKRLRRGFRVDHTKGLFRHYLKRIANREIAKIREGRPLTMDPQSAPPIACAAEPDWAEAERRQRMRVCLDRLRNLRTVSPRNILIFESYALSEVPAEQLALENGISKARVYAIKHEITQILCGLRAEMDHRLGEI